MNELNERMSCQKLSGAERIRSVEEVEEEELERDVWQVL